MKHKSIEYQDAQRYITDKKLAINTFIDYNLDKLQQIFVYANLPDTIPSVELEKLLLRRGHCFITKVNNELYALSGGFSGEVDVYNNPRFYTVTNVALNLSKTYEIGIDGVLFKNDFNIVGVLPLIKKYGALMTEAEISMNTASILSRIFMLISADDDKTKASADLFLSKIYNGEFSIIGENPFFNGVKMQTMPNGNSRYISQYIELIQYYKASFLNEVGLNANFNMKRERLNNNEVALNIDSIFPFVDNMYTERQKAIDEINKMFGTDIIVDYNSIWKTNHEEMEKTTAIEDVELDVIGETENGDEIVIKDDNASIDTDNDTDSNISNSDSDEQIIIDKDDEDDAKTKN